MSATRSCLSFAGALLATAVCLPVSAVNLIDCGDPTNKITATCGQTGVELRIKVNNSPPQNPNVNHSVHLGVGAGTGNNVLQSSAITINPNQCVEAIESQVDPLTVEACGPLGEHKFHTSGPKVVPYNFGQAMTLAKISISNPPNCPGACEVKVPIDYFFEGPDDDSLATWDDDDCDGDTPPTLTVASEALQPHGQCVFEIKCIEKPPSEATGQGPASGKDAKAYSDTSWEPGTTRLSFDLRAAEPSTITEELLEFHLGAPGNQFPVGIMAPDLLDWNQFHALVPTPVALSYEDVNGVLQYFITNQSGQILFRTDVEVPSASPLAVVSLALLLAATGVGWLVRSRRAQRAP